jgi:hypothetical protein
MFSRHRPDLTFPRSSSIPASLERMLVAMHTAFGRKTTNIEPIGAVSSNLRVFTKHLILLLYTDMNLSKRPTASDVYAISKNRPSLVCKIM